VSDKVDDEVNEIGRRGHPSLRRSLCRSLPSPRRPTGVTDKVNDEANDEVNDEVDDKVNDEVTDEVNAVSRRDPCPSLPRS